VKIPDKAIKVFQTVTQSGAISPLFNMFQGRCTFFAICFTIVGIAGWLRGKDLTSYSLFVTAIQGLLVLHSWKEDVAEQRNVRDPK
jgi:hypothetical protein